MGHTLETDTMDMMKAKMEAEGMFDLEPPQTRLERLQAERLTKIVATQQERDRVLGIMLRYAQRAHITDSDRDAWRSAVEDVKGAA